TVVIGLTLGQVVLGTQVRERVDEALAVGTPRADVLVTVGSIDIWHRELALVVLLSSAWLFWIVWSRHAGERPLVRATAVMAAMLAAQILLGIFMAYVSLAPAAQIAHLTVSSLLLGAETVLLLLARWLPEPVGAGRVPTFA